MANDTEFTGSIPENYDRFLVPVLFAPFAADLVAEAGRMAAHDILEIAAGTGAVTEPLADAMPEARIVATDLNPAMVEQGARSHARPNVEWATADAQALPFADGRFDLVLCQFGAMFFPDRIGAYREMRRVLKPGGVLLLNVWDELDRNPGSAVIHAAFHEGLPEPKPAFIARTPFGYADREAIAADLASAGFTGIDIATVTAVSPPGSGQALLSGMAEGSPLAGELAGHDPASCASASVDALDRLQVLERAGPLAMSALRVTALR